MFYCSIGNVTRRVIYWIGVFALDVIAERVDGADDAPATAHVEDVGVDHGCLDIFVTEQLLDGADVVTRHEQVRGE